jgi:2-oxo-3-hexenedioate decarboxylase/2-keto-4-pentenoate hydratase
MPDFNPDAAARVLASARLEHRAVTPLSPGVAPGDAKAGYAVQRHLHELLTAAGEGAVAGHKIGCTTKVMREKLGIDQPCAGQVYAHRLLKSGGSWTVAGLIKPSVECEIAIRLGRDLPPIPRYYTAASLWPAVDSCMASIELCDDRYTDREAVGLSTLIADDFYNVGCALGEDIRDWKAIDLAAITGFMRINGREVGRGKGSDIMEHPLNALAWLANLRASEGRPLKAGEFVTLGSIVSSQRVAAGDRVEIDVESLGAVSLQIA